MSNEKCHGGYIAKPCSRIFLQIYHVDISNHKIVFEATSSCGSSDFVTKLVLYKFGPCSALFDVILLTSSRKIEKH